MYTQQEIIFLPNTLLGSTLETQKLQYLSYLAFNTICNHYILRLHLIINSLKL